MSRTTARHISILVAALTAGAVPIISATADAAPSATDNLASNPGYESGAANWTRTNSDSTLSVGSKLGVNGAGAKVTATKVGRLGLAQPLDTVASAGDTYKVTAYLKAGANATGLNGRLSVSEAAIDGTPVAAATSDAVRLTAGRFKAVSFKYTAENDDAALTIAARTNKAAEGEAFVVDSWQVTQVSPRAARNAAPTPAFTVTRTDLVAAFDASGSVDSDGTIASYAWSFGDGTRGTGKTPRHTYAKAGTYTVKLTTTDNKGLAASVSRSVTVTAANVAPSAAFTFKSADRTVNVDGSTSSDSDGTVASYAWNFGDGTTGTGRTASHTYGASGAKTVTLTVKDDKGAAASTTNTVTVSDPNVAPSAAFTAAVTDLTAALDASGSTDTDGTIASYAWNFGDGTTGTGRTASHTYTAAGTYTVTLTVKDDKGATTTTTRSVTVTKANAAPTAAFTTAASDLTATVDASGSVDTDGTIASYAWNFGDGTTGTGKTSSHTYTAAGTYTVTLKVSDNAGATGSTTRTVSVTSPATPPVGQPTGAALGMYRGNPSESPDAAYLSTYGENPSLTSSYYTTQGPNETYETARVKRGTDVFLDFDTKSTPGQIGLIANRDANTITNWVDRDLKSAQNIAAAGKATGATVYASFTHEWEVKRAQNVLTNTSDRDPATYAKAWNVFAERARVVAPDVKLVYWVGGFSSNFSVIDQVMAGFNFRPDVIAWDPYVTANGNASTTATQLFATFANHLKANPTYVGWGKPTMALGEFGFSLNHGDAAAATFYKGVQEGMRDNGVSMAIQFDRDKQDPTSYVYYKIDGGSSPLSKQAFADEADSVNAS